MYKVLRFNQPCTNNHKELLSVKQQIVSTNISGRQNESTKRGHLNQRSKISTKEYIKF